MDRPTLLIVDDEAAVRRLLRLALGQLADRILEAGDGAEALALAASARPDLVLLDVGLPDLDGYAVCRRLKGDPATAGAAVLLLTGHAGERARREGAEAGADAYLAKPFGLAELVSIAGELLGSEAGAVPRCEIGG